MIIDRYENIENYYDKLTGLKNAVKLIENTESWEAGKRYEFDGGALFYLKKETKAPDECQFETHDKNIDVQILKEGKSWAALWNRRELLTETVPYDSNKDITKYSGDGTYVEMKPGMVCILFPEDGHMPDICLPGQEKCDFIKFVIKLKIH